MAKVAKDATVKDLTVGRRLEIKGGAPRATTKQAAAKFDQLVRDKDLTDAEYGNLS